MGQPTVLPSYARGVAHANPLQVAAYNRLRRDHGLTVSEARTFCHDAALAKRGTPMGDVYQRILDGTLVPPGKADAR